MAVKSHNPSANCDGAAFSADEHVSSIICGRDAKLETQLNEKDFKTALTIRRHLLENPLGSTFGRIVASRIAKRALRKHV